MVKEYDMYVEMLNFLDQYEKDVYSDWCNGLEQACLINLNQPLISRIPSSGLISVNFNVKVTEVITWKLLCGYLPMLKNDHLALGVM